jgi:uncharacterized protein (DUF1778 family)
LKKEKMPASQKSYARFNARLPQEQKQLLEEAAFLGGYRNLTDFILHSAQEKAKVIIREKDLVIASEKDAAIFFDAITNPKKPSLKLKKALADYRSFIANVKHTHDRVTKQKSPKK